jgi:hypothetical protein
MSKDVEPFEELSETDQKTAIDIGVMASVVVTRLPGISGLVMDAIAREFAAQYNIRPNIAKHSLRAIGKTLFQTQWSFEVTKDQEGNIATHFKQGEPLPRENGTTP